MGFMNNLKNIVLRNSQKAISKTNWSFRNDKIDREAVNFEDAHPYKIKKTVKNCRYAYNNNGLVHGLLLNNTIKAVNKWKITYDDDSINNIKDAQKHIVEKCKPDEWDLDKRMSEWLIKAMRDGIFFTHKIKQDGTIQLNELAYDGDKFDWLCIRDNRTGKIKGYKQKYYQTDNPNWKSRKFSDLENLYEIKKEENFEPDELIVGKLFEEDGIGQSLLMPILDDINTVMDYEQYKKSVAHKTGNVALVTVGSDDVHTEAIPVSFVEDVLKELDDRENKDSILIPYGVDVETLGGNYNLPDLNSYINKAQENIYIQLQTPQTLFSSDSSNRSSITVQTDEDTGFQVFLEYLRDFLVTIVNELINEELELNGYGQCKDHIHLTFITMMQERMLKKEFDEYGEEINFGNTEEKELPADNEGYGHSDAKKTSVDPTNPINKNKTPKEMSEELYGEYDKDHSKKDEKELLKNKGKTNYNDSKMVK